MDKQYFVIAAFNVFLKCNTNKYVNMHILYLFSEQR